MKKFGGKDKIQAALERLDQLTKDEVLSAVAQTLGIVHGIADDMRVVIGGAHIFVLANICLNTCFIRWNGTDGHRKKFGYVSRTKQVPP